MPNADTYGNPRSPIITFSVNLTPDLVTVLHPARSASNQDTGIAAAAQFANTRSTFLPGLTAGENRELAHSGRFTSYGMRAKYIKDTYATGASAILSVVTETFASA
jgi:hypothetical protein